MGGINWRRVVLGGLLAGLLSNILGFGFAHLVLWGEVEAVLQRFNLPPFPSYTGPLHLTTRFLSGILLVWLYAAMRPRYGPGPKTALRAGLAVWFFSYLLFAAGMAPWGIFPLRVLLVEVVWALFETAAMAQAGAWLYKEA